jgi:hypothetical protein
VVLGRGVTVLRDDDGVPLLFRRSFADWIWRLVERSSKPCGVAGLRAARTARAGPRGAARRHLIRSSFIRLDSKVDKRPEGAIRDVDGAAHSRRSIHAARHTDNGQVLTAS